MFYQFCLTMQQLLVNTDGAAAGEEENAVLDPTYNALGIIMPVALGVVLLAGTIYSVVLGVQYSKSESADDRNKAKKKLINAIVGFGIVLVLLAVLYAIRRPLANFISG